jgi:hypothetical protein
MTNAPVPPVETVSPAYKVGDAEMDTVRCDVEGCDQTAYIGTRCATHFLNIEQLRGGHVL